MTIRNLVSKGQKGAVSYLSACQLIHPLTLRNYTMAVYEFSVDGSTWEIDLGSYGKETIRVNGKVVSFKRLLFNRKSTHAFDIVYQDKVRRAAVSISNGWFVVASKFKVNDDLIYKGSRQKKGTAAWVDGFTFILLVLPILFRPPLHPLDWMMLPLLGCVIIILYTITYLFVISIRSGWRLLHGEGIKDILYLRKLVFLILASFVLPMGLYNSHLNKLEIDAYGKQLAEVIQKRCEIDLVCPLMPVGWIKDERIDPRYLMKKDYMWLIYRTNSEQNEYTLRVYHAFDDELVFRGGVFKDLESL